MGHVDCPKMRIPGRNFIWCAGASILALGGEAPPKQQAAALGQLRSCVSLRADARQQLLVSGADSPQVGCSSSCE